MLTEVVMAHSFSVRAARVREHNMTILRNFKAYCEEGRDVRASADS